MAKAEASVAELVSMIVRGKMRLPEMQATTAILFREKDQAVPLRFRCAQFVNRIAAGIALIYHQRAGCSKGAAFGWESFSMLKPTAQSLRDESRELRERRIQFSNGQPLEDIFFPRLWPQK